MSAHGSVTRVCPGEETVAAYVAGRLGRADRDAFDAHLDSCSACHELLAALGKLGTGVAAVGTPATSLGVGSTAGAALDDGAGAWEPGAQLGRYVLLARLGVGGMGVVYAAYDPELDRKVALKLLRHAGDDARARLRDEARAIARLAHPNVVAIHDIGEANGEVFAAMEHVDGLTVRDWLRARRTPGEIVEVFVQAARGLAAAHAVGIVHRDVKPSNIIVGDDGRARVLDFGLARAGLGEDGAVVGTPAYMAPEQQRGERVDTRADQFALCVALWEALGGTRPRDAGTLPGIPERITRALRRGLAERPADRFATLDELIRELAPPPPRRRRWVLAALALIALPVTAGLVMVMRADRAPSCELAGAPIAQRWDPARARALQAAFARTGAPFADAAAVDAIARLDDWAARWQASARASCKATVIDRVQAPELDGLRRACLEQLAERLEPVVDLALAADRELVTRAGGLTSRLPAPERCDDVAGLLALAPAPPAEAARAEIAALRAAIASAEAQIIAGRAPQLADAVETLRRRAEAVGELSLRARVALLRARFEQGRARYAEAITALHAGAQAAAAARDLPLLAEIWIELAQALGNDLRTLEEAAVFDGYAAALVERLPARAELALLLALARCNRQLDHARADDATTLAGHCETTIALAERARPPRVTVANAARTRLGHFQRLLGDDARARATLVAAVDEATRVHGPQHPDTAIARYALGMADLAANRIDDGIAQLRQALAIRRAAIPGPNLQVAESLQGLGDALAVKGDHAEAITILDEALAMLAAAGGAETAQAASSHILIGMSLEEVKRPGDASAHYLRAADIADRALQHREALAAMALRLAGDIAGREGRAATGIEHVERALRLLERGKAVPVELGKTQQRLSELLLQHGDRPRARAMAEAARASYVLADAKAQLAELDAWRRQQGWR